MFLILLMLLLTLFFLFFLFHHFFLHANSSKLPPGCFGWFLFISRTLSFISPHVSSSKGQFLEDNIQRYGNIFQSHLFGHPMVVSCDGEFNQFILNNEDRPVVSCYP
ncbi:Abieta-7,13-dien-18-ol hydroxylase protein [Dioscorea alata]|uniref:Abieta-7,13-dien-18-ol hydroxylase protein n=1 Tax=Dioscorea alata TaxID=55571 RepID=A0ACB7WEY7_DIOAL|nr:Abieta-7,13-dien-18-ol hydroxylase protein [Dioscorea alata]